MIRWRAVAVLVLTGSMLALGGAAYAAYATTSTGTAGARAQTLPAPTALLVAGPATAAGVPLAWSPSPGPVPTGYVVSRCGGSGCVPGAAQEIVAGGCASSVAHPLAAARCDDTDPSLEAGGSYGYAVAEVYDLWESPASSTLQVATLGPSPAGATPATPSVESPASRTGAQAAKEAPVSPSTDGGAGTPGGPATTTTGSPGTGTTGTGAGAGSGPVPPIISGGATGVADTLSSVSSLLPASGTVGTSATIVATGFAPGAALTVTVGGVSAPIVSGATPGSDGSSTVTFSVPALTHGTHAVVVSDGTHAAFSSVAFAVQPAIALSPAPAPAPDAGGSAVTISGTGFSAGSALTVTLGPQVPAAATPGVALEPASATDATGSFTGVVLALPALSPGAYLLTVTDAEGVTASAPYSVDSVAAG